jgi:hypothetical protein
MKAWSVYDLLTGRWAPFRTLSEEDRQRLVELVLSLVAEAGREVKSTQPPKDSP